VEGQSITAWRHRKVQAYSTARYSGDMAAAARIAEELRLAHVALGHRETGTREEQNTYLLARSTNTPLPELAAVGINTNDWPEPPSTPTSARTEQASPDTERRISNLFRMAGRLSDREPLTDRYRVVHRPQDDQRDNGTLLPWAICDTTLKNSQGEPLPISYHEKRLLAEYQADQASDRYASLVGEGK
jgi:hypothetical protein